MLVFQKYLRLDPRRIVCRQLIRPEAVVVPVPSIAIIKFLSSARNYSRRPLSKVDIFIL